MADKFKINDEGKCNACSTPSGTQDSVKCFKCNGLFHALCNNASAEEKLATKTMVAHFHQQSTKRNFVFFCDFCLDAQEDGFDGQGDERIVALESKFETIDSQLKEIASKIIATTGATDNAQASYAAVVGSPSSRSPSQSIASKRNAELIDKQEHERRENNIIIYGIDEVHVGNKEAAVAQDKEFVDSFLETIDVEASPKQVVRIGKEATPGKCRPVKLILRKIEDKTAIMSNLNKLKHAGASWNSISIREDYTIEERQLIKQMHEEAKRRNEADEVTHWKVRGTPKKGLKIVKISPDN